MDRTYWNVPGLPTWHALEPYSGLPRVKYVGVCGRSDWFHGGAVTSDRVPAAGHLCGNCSRIIAARTDIEGTRIGRLEFKRGELARVADLQEAAIRHSEDVPEPVASEQDDSV